MENKKGIFQRMKSFFSGHKKLTIGIIAIVLVAVIGLGIKVFTKKDHTNISSNEVAALSKGDLVNSINETGKVVSSTSMDVFSEKSLPIRTLYVKEGDLVKEGDVIAELDSSTIQQQIATKQAARDANRKTIGSQIAQAKNRLNEALKSRRDGTNGALVSANNAVTSSYDNWQSAEKAYENYKKSVEERYNPEIVSEKNARQSLSYQEKSGSLKYKQLQDDLAENKRKSQLNRDLAAGKEREKESLQQRYNDLDRQNTELSIRTNQISQTIAKLEADIAAERQGQEAATDQGNSPTNSSPQINTVNNGKILNLQRDQENLRNETYEITRQQDELKREMARVQEQISTIGADVAKYAGEADALDKEIEGQKKTMDQTIVEMNKAREDIQSDADTAEKNKKAREDQLKTLRQNADTAHNAYLAALESLESTKTQVNNEINTLQDSVKSAGAGLNNVDDIDLKYLVEDLEKTVIKAPVSGTVTVLGGKEGLTPTGAIAKIETVERLQIESHVKEYNIKEVKVGTKVVVSSDSVEDEEFEGKVVSVASTPEEKKQGDNSGDVFYKTVIEIQPKDMEKFNPGMTVRVKYILSEEKNTFSVPSTAIFDRDGKSNILVLEGGEKKTIQKIEVTSGLSNDFETAIKGKKLKEGMEVLTSPAGYSEGQVVKIAPNQIAPDQKKSGA